MAVTLTRASLEAFIADQTCPVCPYSQGRLLVCAEHAMAGLVVVYTQTGTLALYCLECGAFVCQIMVQTP